MTLRMHIDYRDILDRVPDRPLWWLNGVPRYNPFRPQDVDVYARQVALVHTECQDCRTRYDVAVYYPSHQHRHDLRFELDYANALGIGDPPDACPESRYALHAGATMGSIEVALLQFWKRSSYDWERVSEFEAPLRDADWDHTGEIVPLDSAWMRLKKIGRIEEWRQANRAGDVAQLAALFASVGCRCPKEVANMVDIDRRHEQFWKDMGALAAARRQG